MSTQRLLGDGSVAQGVVALTAAGEIADTAPNLQLALIGNAANYYPALFRGQIFGKRSAINDALVDLWEGPTAEYVFPTVPQQMRLVSSSANDTVAGTGIRKIRLTYLNMHYQSVGITIDLNGTTPVLTLPTDIIRVNFMRAAEVGSGGKAAGNISLTNVAGTVTYSYIQAGLNLARQAVFTVPDGYAGYVNHWQVSSGSSGNHFCQAFLLATSRDGILVPGVFLGQDEQGTQNNGIVINLPIPIPIAARADLKIAAISDASNANVTALAAIMGWVAPLP